MKRDMDLVRTILARIEELEWTGNSQPISIEGSDQLTTNFHVMLLHEARLIDAHNRSTTNDPTDWAATRLTWEGYEFLDAARSETLWKKAKGIIAEKGGSMAYDVVKSLLIELGKQAVLPSLTGRP